MTFPCRVQTTKCSLLPDGYLVVYHTELQKSYVIPPLGAVVWEFCDGQHSTIDIIEATIELAKTHGVVPPNLSDDVSRMIKNLSDAGFITVFDGTVP